MPDIYVLLPDQITPKMLALLTARPSLNSSAPLSIVLLFALLACTPLIGMSQENSAEPVPYVTATTEDPGQMEEPPTELTQTNKGNNSVSVRIRDCFDIKTPYGLTFADGSELTVEWGLEELQDKMQAERPGRIPNGFVFPLTIDYIDGTSELISSQETMEARINSCNNE